MSSTERQPRGFWTAQEVADLFQVSERTITRYCNNEIIPAIRAGRDYRIANAVVERLRLEGFGVPAQRQQARVNDVERQA